MKIIKPSRKSFTYVQHLEGNAKTVFSLLCPVLESKWLYGWDPEIVISNSGVAEKDCYFMTKEEPQNRHWVVIEHNEKDFKVEMICISPSKFFNRFNIELIDNDQKCEAKITYNFTSIGGEGDKILKLMDDEWYIKFMHIWERAVNYYLKTGKRLEDDEQIKAMESMIG